MELRKRPQSRKAPALAALTLAGAGAGAIAVMKRDRILKAVGLGSGEEGAASSTRGASAEGDPPSVTRLPKPYLP